MTALMPEVETTYTVETDPLMIELQAALDAFSRTAHFTSEIPAAVVNALRSPEPCVISTTCYGAPITLSTDAGAMTDEALYYAWREVQAQTPAPGVHVHVTADGDARVDAILHTHKSQARSVPGESGEEGQS
jgi:hypothetical protein